MSTKCIKCGYTRQSTDTAPNYECPKCGVIYSKAKARLENILISTPIARVTAATPDSEGATVPSELDRQPGSSTDSRKDKEVYESTPYDLDAEPVPDFSKRMGLIGSLLLLIGVLLPIIRLPMIGTMNYLGMERGDGVVIVLMAVLSIYFVLRKRPVKLFWTASGSLSMLTFTFVHFKWALHQGKAQMDSLSDNPFRGLGELLLENSVRIEWGWIVLVLGVVFLFISAISDKYQIFTLNHLTRFVSSSIGLSSAVFGDSPLKQSLADEVVKLDDLFRKGSITKDEFDQLKAKLLK